MNSTASDYVLKISSSNGGKLHGLLMEEGKQILINKYKKVGKIKERNKWKKRK